ncbi:choice-of-anchor D domain-containing protein [Povalibacter sp.]|uniref:choice-of-anchor D domain-containing protein n=1 Tax=Povalibacter sp. TaxID=1962978 RepID=UPI002F405CC3
MGVINDQTMSRIDAARGIMRNVLVTLALIFSISSGTANALTTITVALSSDNDPGGFGEMGDLRYALNSMNQDLNTTADDYAIVFASPMTIQLNGILPIINNSPNPVSITIGNPGAAPTVTIDGNGGTYSGFFIPIGNVTVQNMTFQNLTAKGGNGGDGISGGGGGMGAGGAIYAPQYFLNGSNPSITLMNVFINNSAAIGGDGGNYMSGSPTGNEGGGGGGGFGGNGGSIVTTGATGGAGGGGFGGDGGDVTLSVDMDVNGGGGGGGGGLGSRATIGTLANLGNGGSDQSVGLDGNGYGLSITAGSGGGGNSGGNNAGGGGGGAGSGGGFLPPGGGGGGSAGTNGSPPQGSIPPFAPSDPIASGGNGGEGAGGGGGGVVSVSFTNEADGKAGGGGYGGGGGGAAGTGAYDVSYSVQGGLGGTGGGGGGGGVNQSGTTSADGGNSLGGGGGAGGGPSNGPTAQGGADIGNLGGGSGGSGANTYGSGFGGGGGGGGSGIGGAIFVDSNLNFTVQALSGVATIFNTSNTTTHAGAHGIGGPGGSDGTDGSAVGNSIFLRTGSALTFRAQDAGDLLTLGDQVAFTDDTNFGAGGTSVFVAGKGTVVYNGTTDYQGTVTVNNANFKVNGQIDAASVFVCRNSNVSSQRGTLSGVGTLTGNVFANSGTIAPDPATTLTLGSLTLNSAYPSGSTLGSLVNIAIDSNSVTSVVSVTGPASLAGTLQIDLDPDVTTGSYRFLTSSSITGTFDTVVFSGATPLYSINYQHTYVEFVFTGFPPPPAPVPQFSPGSIDFGARPIQTAHQLSVTLINAGNANLTVNGFSISGAFTAADDCPATLAPNASCAVQVTFSPDAVGNHSGVLQLNSDAPGAPAAVTLNGAGTSEPQVTEHQVTAIVANGNGTISPATVMVAEGQRQTFTVTPAAGYSMSSVSGCGGSLSGSTFTTAPISQACSITAAFEPRVTEHQVTVIVANGEGTLSPAAVMVAEGQTQTFTVTPAAGYSISRVSGCGGSLSGSTFTTAPISQACFISAAFAVVVTAKGKAGGGSMNFLTVGGLLIMLLARCFRRRFRGGVALLLVLPGMAQAGDFNAWYAGARLGSARTDVSSADVNHRLNDLGYDVSARVEDSSRTAWGVFGGWRVSQHFGVQLGYTHLGTVETAFTGDALDIQAFLRDANRLQPRSASGLDLNLVGRHPLGKGFEITAQLGAFAWNADYTVSNSLGDFVKREENGIDLTYGAGLEYALDGGLAFTGGWTRYKVDSESMDFLGVGLQYRWR